MLRCARFIALSVLAIALGGCQATTTRTSGTAGESSVSASASAPSTPAPAASSARPAPGEPPMVTIEGGLRYQDLRVGDGAIAEAGMTAVVHYTGRFSDGRKFDSSHDRGEPYPFRIGAQTVVLGWDKGVVGMRVGGLRKLICPPEYGFGSEGAGNGTIPPNATLVFEIELLDLR